MERSAILLAARTALAENIAWITDLMVRQDDLTTPIGGGSRWTVREVAAHLVVGLRMYSDLAAGVPVSLAPAEGEAPGARGERMIAAIGETDPEKLAAVLRDAAESFLGGTSGSDTAQPISYYGGTVVDLADLTSVLVGEAVLHGYDLAQAVRAPWPIDPAHALLAVGGYATISGLLVNPATTTGLTVAYGLHLRGAPSVVARFVDGAYAREPGGAAEAEIAADPVAFLLVSAGRLDRWPAIACGAITLGGAKPDLAATYWDRFVFP